MTGWRRGKSEPPAHLIHHRRVVLGKERLVVRGPAADFVRQLHRLRPGAEGARTAGSAVNASLAAAQ